MLLVQHLVHCNTFGFVCLLLSCVAPLAGGPFPAATDNQCFTFSQLQLWCYGCLFVVATQIVCITSLSFPETESLKCERTVLCPVLLMQHRKYLYRLYSCEEVTLPGDAM